MKIRDFRNALKDAQWLITLHPDWSEGYFYSFFAHLYQENYKEAETLYHDYVGRVTGLNRTPMWSFQMSLEGCFFKILGEGQSFALPPDIAQRPPFYLLRQSAELYSILKQKAKPFRLPEGFWLAGGWSPDGKYLVYQQHRSFSWLPGTVGGTNPANGNPHIEIMDLQTGNTRQLGGFGFAPKWSPDGNYIAYDKRDGNEAEFGVWLSPTAGGQPRRLSAGRAIKWARDSKHIYFTNNGSLYSIAIGPPGTTPVLLDDTIFKGFRDIVRISPKEDFIATSKFMSGSISEIRIQTFPDGNEVARWKLPWPLAPWSIQLQWHPNGKTLILNSGMNYNQMGMCLFDIETGEVRHGFNLPRPWCKTLWCPDGSQCLINPLYSWSSWIMETDHETPLEKILALSLPTEPFLSMLEKQWDRRIAADPNYAIHYVARSVIQLAEGDYQNAERGLKQCICQIDAANDPALYALQYWGRVYIRVDYFREAEMVGLVNLQLSETFPDQYPEISQANHPYQQLRKLYEKHE